jgi:uncharacterized membrane protein
VTLDMAFGQTVMVGVVAIMTIAVPVIVIALLVQAARRPPPDPREVLAARLTRGDITREEYEAAMRNLGSTPGER